MTSIKAKDAVRELWYRGILQYKLHETQKKMLASYLSQTSKISVICCARRSGKSFLLCLLAIEQCLKHPNSVVKYVCPTKRMVKDIIQPLMNDLFKDCPPELKAEFKTNDYTYMFPNGSRIQMAGTDNGHHETLRGSRSDFWVVDEAGFCDDLNYVVKTVLAPTTDTTGGRGILASTPSKTPDHEFITDFFLPYKESGQLILYTMHDNPLLTPEVRREIIDRYRRKEEDPEFLREYMCKIEKSPELMVVPEMTDELKEKIIKEYPKPPFYDSYVSMDIGGRDWTVVLFAYYDFRNAKIVIEDELVFMGNEFRIDDFAEKVAKKERQLWTHPVNGEFKPPFLRIADNNNVLLLSDLTYRHNLTFLPTQKTDKLAYLNTMRSKLSGEQIIIDPKCKTLIHHLDNATWAKNKKDYLRSGGDNPHHYDAVDSLTYLVRNIIETKNPYPSGYGAMGRENHFYRDKEKVNTPQQQTWIELFKARKSNINRN